MVISDEYKNNKLNFIILLLSTDNKISLLFKYDDTTTYFEYVLYIILDKLIASLYGFTDNKLKLKSLLISNNLYGILFIIHIFIFEFEIITLFFSQ